MLIINFISLTRFPVIKDLGYTFLIRYYCQLSQVAEYDQDREETLDRLEKFKTAAESQHSSQWKVQQKDEEVKALQKAISDLQVCLFQEREQVRILWNYCLIKILHFICLHSIDDYRIDD